MTGHRPRPRLLVLGLDGLPFSLAKTLSNSGATPHLATLALAPEARAIAAELPELSPVNWTSFATAVGPEEHGVFGFTRIRGADYSLSLTDSTHVACPTIFERLGDAGLVSRVINLPNTYPAKPLRGMLVAGFTAPELRRAVYPPVLYGPLAAAGYQLEADTERGGRDPDFLLSELRATLSSRRKALDLFWPDLAWDLFVFVLTETDRLFHFLYPAVVEAEHALHGPVMELLREWDALIGAVLERYHALPEPKALIVLADHGFTKLRVEVDINAWLREQGSLRLAPASAGNPDPAYEAGRILPESRAFALDPGRVYMHVESRFGRGRLGPKEALDLRERIREGLLTLRFEGELVMQAVHRAEELYPGPQLASAPDLVCQAKPGFDLKAKFDRDAVFGFFGRSGAHTAEDVFYYEKARGLPDPESSPSADNGPARVRDVGARVLRSFGLATHADKPAPLILHDH